MKVLFGIILILLGFVCVVTAGIWQQVLCYQTFGCIFKEVFIPHWSMFFYLGLIPLITGWYIVFT